MTSRSPQYRSTTRPHCFKADDQYITLRANDENVANKAYWSSASTANNYLTQGEPRTLKLSATVDF
jgi:iron complex outermembrane receptor protein